MINIKNGIILHLPPSVLPSKKRNMRVGVVTSHGGR